MAASVQPSDAVPRRLSAPAAALLLGLAYFAAAHLCLSLPRDHGRVAPIWIANAVALAALVRSPPRRWPLLAGACLAGNLTASLAFPPVSPINLVLPECNLVEYLSAAVLLRRWMGPDPRVGDARQLGALALVGAACGLASAALAGLVLRWTTPSAATVVMQTWALAHPLALVLFTPCFLILARPRAHLAERPATLRAVLSLLLLVACSVLVFSQTRAPLLFLAPPALLFVSLELGVFGAALGVLVVAVVAVVATLSGRGPITLTQGGHLERDAVLQVFLLVSLLSSLPVAGLQARRRRSEAAALAEAERATRAEAAAARSEARYRLLADKATDAIATFGLDGRLTYLSPSVAAVTGYAPHEMVGRSGRRFIHPDDYPAVAAAIGDLASGARAPGTPIEYRLRRKDGSWMWVQVNPQPVRGEADGSTSFVDVARDVTARKLMEVELEAARAEALAAAAAKAEFLANMSHELRTPLTAVLGFADLLAQQPELSVDSRRYLDRVRTAGKSLLTTVNDVLDFSRLEAGHVDVSPWPTSPAELAREVVAMFDVQAAAKGLALRATGLELLPPLVDVDPDRVRQVLVNFVGNAVKFTERGEVRLELAHADGRLRAAVVDTGPGIDAERVGQLFQRFSQVDASSTRRHGGTGLGLAICKGLAEAMGGSVSVESRRGEGSTFGFELPAVPSQMAAAPAAEEAPPAPDRGGRVLVADDSAPNRELVKAALAPFGLALELVEGGAEAVEAAALRGFDLILMDLRMPGVDGRQAAGAIRGGGGPNRATPIVAFSADALADPGPLFDGVLAKPLSPLDLVRTLAAHLSRPDPHPCALPETHAAA